MDNSILVHVEPINSDLSSRCSPKGQDITWFPWSRTTWSLQKDARYVNIMGRSKTTSRTSISYHPFLVIHGIGYRHFVSLEKLSPEMQIHIGRQRLLSQMGRSHPNSRRHNVDCLGLIQIHIIDLFGILETITDDNCQPFRSAALYILYAKNQNKGDHSSWYYAPANKLAEVFKKTFCRILEKMEDKDKKMWHNR